MKCSQRNGDVMFVSKRDRRAVRQIAASEWNRINNEDNQLSVEERVRVAKQRTKDRIGVRFTNTRGGFGSLISTLLVSLLVRIAFKMIENWLERKLFTVDELGHD